MLQYYVLLKLAYLHQAYDGLPALGIVGERRKELCAVERSTAANAEPRKARPPQDTTVKNF